MTLQGLRAVLLEEGRKELESMDLSRIQNALDDYKIGCVIPLSNEKTVLDYIERKFDVINCLNNRTKFRRYCYARWCYWWYLRKIKRQTLMDIGFKTKFDHASVIYGVKQIDTIHFSHQFFDQVSDIKSKLS